MTSNQIKLAVFDVDGTLLRGDTACLWIARRLSNYDRMLELEQSRGKPDVSAAREEMASWYRGLTSDALLADLEGFPWAPGLFEGMRMLRDAGVKIALASVGWEFVVKRIAEEIGAQWTLATKLDFSTGDIGHAWGEHKVTFASSLTTELKIDRESIAAVGDSDGDSPMLDYAGLAIFVGPSLPPGKNYLHMPSADIRDIAVAILKS